MDLPIPIDEKKIKIIKDYPMLTLVIALMGVICYLFYLRNADANEYKEHLKQDLIKAEKVKEKDDQLLDLWRDLGRQAATLNKMSLKNDTAR